MTTNDTRAALEAAIDALIDAEDIDTRAVVAAEAGDKAAIEAIWTTEPIALMRRTELRTAISAHVEAEVARRLAPNLELWRWKCHDETIEQAIERLVRERNEYAEKLCERNAALVMAPDVEAAIVDYALAAQGDLDTSEERDALRAAIAADKARAVEAEATRRDAEIFGLRARLAIVAEIAEEAISSASEAPDCHEQVQDYRERMRKWRMSKPARPTPDEARRLVDEFERACDAWQYREAEARTAARTALLRVLGVEA